MSSITEKLSNTISNLVSKLTGGNGPGPGGGPGGGSSGLNNSFTHVNIDDSMLGIGKVRSDETGMPRTRPSF